MKRALELLFAHRSEISHAKSCPIRLVRIGRADAPACGANGFAVLALSRASIFYDPINCLVIIEHDVRSGRNRKPRNHIDACFLQYPNFFKQGREVENHAVSEDDRLARMKTSRG